MNELVELNKLLRINSYTLTLLFVVLLSACPNDAAGPQKPIDVTVSSQQISSDNVGNSRQNVPILLFNDSGDGVSLWESDTGNGTDWMTASYNITTKKWSAPEVLVSFINRNVGRLQLATDGKSFGIVWPDVNEHIFFVGYNLLGNSSWGTPVELTDTTDWERNSGISPTITALKGKGYAVMWTNRVDEFVTLYDGSNWSMQPIKIFTSKNPLSNNENFDRQLFTASSLPYRLIADNNTYYAITSKYVVKELPTPTEVSYVLFSQYDMSTNTWSAPVALNDINRPGVIRGLTTASSSKGFAAAWSISETIGSVVVQLFVNTYQPATQWAGEKLIGNIKTAVASGPGAGVRLVGNNTGYAIAYKSNEADNYISLNTLTYLHTSQQWLTKNVVANKTYFGGIELAASQQDFVLSYSDNSAPGFYLSVFDSGSDAWKPATLSIPRQENEIITTSELIMQSAGNDFMAVYTNQDSVSLERQLNSVLFDVSAGVINNKIETALPLSKATDFKLSLSGSTYWLGLGASFSTIVSELPNTNAMKFDIANSQWIGEPSGLALHRAGSATLPKLSVNDRGDVLSTWFEFSGGHLRLNYALHPAENRSTENPTRGSISSTSNDFVGRRNLDRLYQINSTNNSFLITSETRDDVTALVYDGSNWLAPHKLSTLNTGEKIDFHNISATNTGFLVIWGQSSGDSQQIISASRYEDGQWTMPFTFNFGETAVEKFVMEAHIIAETTARFAIIWLQLNEPNNYFSTNELYGQIFNDSNISTPKLLNSAPNIDVSKLDIAANNQGVYLITWMQRTSVASDTEGFYQSFYSGATGWDNATKISQAFFNNVSIVTHNASFALSGSGINGITTYVYNGTELINTEKFRAQNLFYNTRIHTITASPNGFALFMKNDVYGESSKMLSRKFDGSFWSEPIVIIPPTTNKIIGLFDPIAVSLNNKYSLIWSQFDSELYPSTSRIWATFSEF
ncbi:MAG: hypothetical protein ACC707_11375 [Thiohalomonadales bacterium]